MNIAHLVTLFRIVALPVIIVLLLIHSYGASIAAMILLLLALLSDRLDGYIARKREEVTKIGSFLDPFADKLLVMGLLLFFFFHDQFWLSALLVFIVRDIFVGVIHWMAAHDDIQIKEQQGYGVIVLYSQFGILFSFLLRELFQTGGFSYLSFPATMVRAFTILTVVLAVLSLLAYIYIYFHGVRNKRLIGKLLKKEEIIILANCKSRGYFDGYRRHLLNVFRKRRKAKLVFLPKIDDMLQGLKQRVGRIRHVVIAGGDGSFEAALNYKPFWKKSLGFFPLGAGNAYYSQFYKGKRFEYLRSRFKFRETLFDVLEVEWKEGQKERRRQTGFLSIGVDADIARLTTHQRTLHGFRDYVSACLKAAREVESSYDLICQVDGKRHYFRNTVTMTLAKTPYLGYGFRSLVGTVHQDDGQVYGSAVVNRHFRLSNKPLRLWAFLLARLNLDKAPLFNVKGTKIDIRSDKPFPIQAGGEFLGYAKAIHVRVARQQKVLVI